MALDFNLIDHNKIKKRRVTVRTYPLIWLPPSDHTHDKHRTVHAILREPSYCLFSCVNIGGIRLRENKSIKAQYLKNKERKRLINNSFVSLFYQTVILRTTGLLAFLSCVNICFLF